MPSYQVRLLPGNRQFLAASSQSLLRAGLEAGFNLRYGCEGGSCGECLAQCVSGSIKSIRHSDFQLNEQQKSSGYFISCCHAAASDCEILFDEIDRVQDLPQQQIMTRVYRIHNPQPDVMVLTLKTPRTQPLKFLAGQHVRLTLPNGMRQNKSLASCPCDGLKPEFHFHRRQGDAFSEFLFQHLSRNDSVTVEGPMGNFTLDETSSRPLLFVAYETGFSGIQSILEHVIAQERQQPLCLVWINTTKRQPYRQNYCRSLSDALDNFEYHFLSLEKDDDDDALIDTWRQSMKRLFDSPCDLYLTVPKDKVELAQQVFASDSRIQQLFIDDIPAYC